MTLLEVANNQISKNPHVRTLSFFFNNEKVWLKQPAYGEKNIWHSILWLTYKISKNSIFTPTVVTNPKESLAYEAKRLKELKKLNINVPDLFLEHEDFLVLSDAGESVCNYLNNKNILFKDKKNIVENMSFTMANIHNRGIYHSRPALKDITCKNNNIYFIDFEENLEKTLTLEKAIIRDSCIYMHSIFKSIKNLELRDVALNSYRNILSKDIQKETKSILLKYKIIVNWTRPFAIYLGRDGAAICHLLEYLI